MTDFLFESLALCKRSRWTLLVALASLIWFVLPRPRRTYTKQGEGLKTVRPGSGPQIIFVHGLGSEQTRAWTFDKICWPQDLLPSDIPQAGIHLYGYDSSWMWEAPIIDITSLAEKLVETIEALPAECELVFVAHSHGGLIVKEALVRGKLMKRVKGLFFFGTPHRGSRVTGFATFIATLLAPFGARGDILASIKPQADALLDLQERFVDAARPPPPISNYYEGRPTVLFRLLGIPIRFQIVDKSSATLNLSNCRNVLVQRNHIQLNKFTHRTNDYNIFVRRLQHCLKTQTSVTSVDRQEKLDCLRSLAFRGINGRRNDVKNPLSGTGDWLLNSEEYKGWLYGDHAASNGVLWIRGHPGTGKSTLTKHLYLELKDKFTSLSYFFHARGSDLQKSALGLYRSLVCQLLEQDAASCNAIVDTWRRNVARYADFRWEEGSLQHLILTNLACHRRLLLVVDALDECNEREVAKVVSYLENLSLEARRRQISIRIVLSSRHYPSIDMRARTLLTIDKRQEHMNDLKLYIKQKSREPELATILFERSNGVFIWLVLVVAMLNKAREEGRSDLHQILERLPDDLNDLYGTLISRSDAKGPESLRAFIWVLFSKEPLSPRQLYSAVVFETEGSVRPLASVEFREVIAKAIRRWSVGLIEVVENRLPKDETPETDPHCTYELSSRPPASRREVFNPTFSDDFEGAREHVQFIHQTVIEFFLRYNRLQQIDDTLKPTLGACYGRLSKVCEQYVSAAEHIRISSAKPLNLPFLGHAISNIVFYAESAAVHGKWDSVLIDPDRFESFYSSYKALEISCSRLWSQYCLAHRKRTTVSQGAMYTGDIQSDIDNESEPLLHMLARQNAINLTKSLLTLGAEPNVRGGFFGNALIAAAWIGNVELVRLLIDAGADMDARHGFHSSALMVAIRRGNSDIVRLLVRLGVDVNLGGGHPHYLHPLCEIFKWDPEDVSEIFNLLLNAGADPRVGRGSVLRTAVEYAGSSGDSKPLYILLSLGVDVNASEPSQPCALQVAISTGHMYVVELLLQAGADINACTTGHGSALYAAVAAQNEEVFRMLLRARVDVNLFGGRFGNALQASIASPKASLYFVRALITAGADVNAEGGDWGLPLAAAAAQQNGEEIVKLLLQAGAKINAVHPTRGTALQVAATHGSTSTVQLLLDEGADIYIGAGTCNTALQSAAAGGRVDNLRCILNTITTTVSSRTLTATTPVSIWAAYRRGNDTVQPLLNVQARQYLDQAHPIWGTALHYAIHNWNHEAVQNLLEAGADFNKQAGKAGSALSKAVQRCNAPLVERLLKGGANSTDCYPMRDLRLTCKFYHEDDARSIKKIFELLVQLGSSTDAADGLLSSFVLAIQRMMRMLVWHEDGSVKYLTTQARLGLLDMYGILTEAERLGVAVDLPFSEIEAMGILPPVQISPRSVSVDSADSLLVDWSML